MRKLKLPSDKLRKRFSFNLNILKADWKALNTLYLGSSATAKDEDTLKLNG